jgi:hypothetical protein
MDSSWISHGDGHDDPKRRVEIVSFVPSKATREVLRSCVHPRIEWARQGALRLIDCRPTRAAGGLLFLFFFHMAEADEIILLAFRQIDWYLR